MKNSRNLPIIAFITVIIFSSCAVPKPVIRVIPSETKTTWEQGKEFVSYQKNDFVVHCAYHGTDASYLIFDVEVINGSQEIFLLEPEKFTMYTDSGRWDSVTNQYIYSTMPINAADPEYQLLKLDMQESITEAQIKNQQTAAVVVAVATIPVLIATASADLKDTKPRVVTSTDIAATTSIGVMNGLEVSHDENINTINAIGYKQNVWNQFALRKTSLSPGESARGLIYFLKPELEKFRDIRINAPILNNNSITFDFRVILYYPSVNQQN